MLYNYVKAIAGLALCIGFILIAVSLLRKHQGRLEKLFSGRALLKTDARRLRAIERLQLAPGHTAVLIAKDDEEHFVVLSPGGMQTISRGKVQKNG